MFSIGKDGHDRHLGLKNGYPYHRVWKGNKWTGKMLKNYSDGNWHKWKFIVKDGEGQFSYIDDELVGTFNYDHSDFNWKSEIRLGFSEDISNEGNNMGEIKDV